MVTSLTKEIHNFFTEEVRLEGVVDEDVIPTIKNIVLQLASDLNPEQGEAVMSERRREALVDEALQAIDDTKTHILMKLLLSLGCWVRLC